MKQDDRYSHLRKGINEKNKKQSSEIKANEVELAKKQKKHSEKSLSLNNQIATTQTDNEEIKKIDNDFINKIVFVMSFLIVCCILNNIIFKYKEIVFTDLSYGVLLFLIAIYYANIIIHNFNISAFKSIILNFLSVIGLYNIAIIWNPMNMPELSSSYFISNIIYFYASFWILTINYNLYEKLDFCIDFIFGMWNLLIHNFFIAALLITAAIMILSYIFPFYVNPFFLEAMLIIFLFYAFLSFVFYRFNRVEKNHNNYKKTKKLIQKTESFINAMVSWLLDIFKVEKMNHTQMFKKDGIKSLKDFLISIKNMSIFFLVKIIPLVIIIALYETNTYYMMYVELNEGYCKNIKKETVEDELVESKIIKLKNDNVFKVVIPENFKSDTKGIAEKFKYQEMKCDQEMRTINIDFDILKT